ncbi:GNAT family N-acetyltransferase [Acetobacterium carbinolicum]|uniref:GNAT family N-acetyltransferase n=1 Tax=Acetobacterium carbinolicum TaxID=52690 RepID=UPI0039C96537
MIKGQLVNLTAIEKYDLDQLMAWRNQTGYRKYFREHREINNVMQTNWFENKVINDPTTIMLAIRKSEDNELLGCCGLCYINWINGSADLSLYIGWNNTYIDEIGYAEESCELLFQYAFSELRLNRIWTEIYEIDKKKDDLYQKIGMTRDGILRESYFYDGKYLDSYIFSVLRSDYLRE